MQRQEFARRLEVAEKRQRGKIQEALGNQISSFIEWIQQNGLAGASGQVDQLITFGPLVSPIRKLWITEGVIEANYRYRALRKVVKKRTMGYSQEWTNYIMAYLNQDLLNRATLPITNTTKDIVRQILEQGVKEGWGVEETVRRIQERTGELSRIRSRMITRTEVVGAKNLGAMMGAASTGIVYDKVWMTAKDRRVRPQDGKGGVNHHAANHMILEGQKRAMHEEFSNGLLQPGDKTQGTEAGEVINCRCTVRFEAKRDSRGRILRYNIQPTRGNLTNSFNSIGLLLRAALSGINIGYAHLQNEEL